MPGDIQASIAALEECIKTTASERVLVEEIDDRLQELRGAYARDKSGFEVSDLQRLWFASYIRDLAQDLMRVRQQLASVRDPRAYPGLECALAELEEGLRDTAVVERIRKEQAEIAAKAPPHRA